MTSDPTQAMAAAARGEGFAIGYGGVAQYDYAPAVGRAFVRAASAPAGAVVANFPGLSASMEEVVAAIEAAAPEIAEQISWEETPLPFPAKRRGARPRGSDRPVPQPSLAEGIAETIEFFRRT